MNKRELAEELCRSIYTALAPRDIYPALTGGTLYKDGERKDIDIILYRGTQGGILHVHDVSQELIDIGVKSGANYGRVAKGTYKGVDIDFIFPEAVEGTYPVVEENSTPIPAVFNVLNTGK